jgi:hypothetical protein
MCDTNRVLSARDHTVRKGKPAHARVSPAPWYLVNTIAWTTRIPTSPPSHARALGARSQKQQHTDPPSTFTITIAITSDSMQHGFCRSFRILKDQKSIAVNTKTRKQGRYVLPPLSGYGHRESLRSRPRRSEQREKKYPSF